MVCEAYGKLYVLYPRLKKDSDPSPCGECKIKLLGVGVTSNIDALFMLIAAHVYITDSDFHSRRVVLLDGAISCSGHMEYQKATFSSSVGYYGHNLATYNCIIHGWLLHNIHHRDDIYEYIRGTYDTSASNRDLNYRRTLSETMIFTVCLAKGIAT